MGKREKREQRKQEREAAKVQKDLEDRKRWRDEILRQQCPTCGACKASQFVYGMISVKELQEELDADLIVPGGSAFGRTSPLWICRECRCRWGNLGE